MSEAPNHGTMHESLVQELVGDGKKYKDLEELAKSRIAADQHIEKLEQEMKELRENLGQQHTIKDVMDAFKTTQRTDSNESVTPLDDESLQQKITQMIEEREAERTRRANRSEAEKLVQSKTDSDPREFVENKAKSLGLSPDQLWRLSEDSPLGFANLVGLGSSKPQTGSANSLPHQSGSLDLSAGPVLELDGHKTKAFFDAQRRELGNKKFLNDRKMQLQMIRSREALGDKFYQ